MPKHAAAPEPKPSILRRYVRHAMHPAVHILALVGLHVVALAVLEASGLSNLMKH